MNLITSVQTLLTKVLVYSNLLQLTGDEHLSGKRNGNDFRDFSGCHQTKLKGLGPKGSEKTSHLATKPPCGF